MTELPLSIALAVYRGNPHSGGQGVYTRELARELVHLGHSVTVFSGQPYPELTEGVDLLKVPSLDLYRQPDPFRVPHLREFTSAVDVAEFALMCTAAFPEPFTFSLRLRKLLNGMRDRFDILHDNQCLGTGIAHLVQDGWPVLETLHHPITVDFAVEMAHEKHLMKRLSLRRWYSFLAMQKRVLKHLPRVLTVSESSKRDIITQMGGTTEQLRVVHVGVDINRFKPLPHIERVPGRIMTTASSDVPMKGVVPLLEAVAKLRTEREVELVVVGKPKHGSKLPCHIERLGLTEAVTFHSGISFERIVELYASSQVAVVPSLYEGFSLPAAEAMACGVPLVGTTGGAIPEVVGAHGETGLLVPPGDIDALFRAIGQLLEDTDMRSRLGEAGRKRILENFTWRRCAERTAEHYYEVLAQHHVGLSDSQSRSQRRGRRC